MSSAAIPDLDLTFHAKVNNAIRTNPYLSQRKLRCETDEGNVTLRGIVSSYFQKQMAQETVRTLDGVREIRNELMVDPAHRAC